jgi:hypothetical protein
METANVKTRQVAFRAGGEYNFGLTISETEDVLMSNTTVTFTLENETGGVFVDGSIEEATAVPQGSFVTNVWSVGDLQNASLAGSFKLVVTSDDVEYVKVNIKLTTTVKEKTLANNIGSYEFSGFRYEDFASLTGGMLAESVAADFTAMPNKLYIVDKSAATVNVTIDTASGWKAGDTLGIYSPFEGSFAITYTLTGVAEIGTPVSFTLGNGVYIEYRFLSATEFIELASKEMTS